MGFLEEVIEARHYMAAKGLVEHTTDATRLPDTEMVGLAQVIELELQREDITESDHG